MSDVYQIVNIGLLDGQRRLDAIGMNAASAALPGYRRHIVAGRAFDAALGVGELGKAAGSSRPSTGAQLPGEQVSLKAGALLSTGRALDAAIESDDLFFALTDGVQTWLTRNGSFRLNSQGVLVGERDLHVVGASGDVRLPGGDVTVEADGRITRDGVTVATLQLFKPTDPASLRAAAGTLLTTDAEMLPADSGVARVRGSALEASNTDSTNEVIGLMSLTRQFESLSRVAQSYDAVVGRLIQQLGEG